jgi:hypothetical protein
MEHRAHSPQAETAEPQPGDLEDNDNPPKTSPRKITSTR